MAFARTETQTMLADMFARLIDEKDPVDARRERLSGDDPDRLALWPLFAEQGILGAAFDETAGGFGGSMRDLAVVMEEVGRSLIIEPVMASALAGRLAGDAVGDIIAGHRVLALAIAESADIFAPSAVMSADARLTGSKPVVRHGDIADSFLVSAVDGIHVIASGASGLTVEPVRLMDGSSAAQIDFNATPSGKIAGPDAVADLVARACVALAAETSGIVTALNSATFVYLQTRKQFGVPLASFQALQHRAADMFIAAEELRVLIDQAIDAIDTAADDAPALASAAKALADKAGRHIAHEAVQLHGGMGVSDELIVSHYLRRLAVIRGEFGSADVHRDHFLRAGGAVLSEAPEMAAFRREASAFVSRHLPAGTAGKVANGQKLDKDDLVGWQKILQREGWFAPSWPREHGGAGWDLKRQLVFLQQSALDNAPMIVPYGVNMVGPVLQAFGDDVQRARHLPGILSSDVWWCQGYSEPNSGSDLASLRTTAVRVSAPAEAGGDHYIVNGTKMWTTEAHWADWMHCLVRTGRDVKAQQGISFLLIDMTSPGITIRPIVTIDGQHHTNQLFLDDVRVPAENLVGGEGGGWSIAKFLLSHERVAIADTGSKLRLLRRLKTMFADLPDTTGKTVTGQKLADAEIQLLALCALEQDYVDRWSDGGTKEGPEGSVLKIRGTEILQLLTELALEILGPLGAIYDPADVRLESDKPLSPVEQASTLAYQYLYGRCWSIFGGSNEIQRNIVARSILR